MHRTSQFTFYAALVLLLIALITAGAQWNSLRNNPSLAGEQLGEQGFGSLASGFAAALEDARVTSAAGDKDSVATSMIAPDIYPGGNFQRYTTTVTAPSLSASKVTVYRSEERRPSFNGVQGTFAVPSGARVENTTVRLDEKTVANIDYVTGSISISRSSGEALDIARSSMTAMSTEGELLTEAEVLQVTRAAISEFGIDTSNFGAPVVSSNHVGSATVVYPLTINGMAAVESYGIPHGISVFVTTYPTKEASSITIPSRALSSATYEAVTDGAAVKAYVEKAVSQMYDFETPVAAGAAAKVLPFKEPVMKLMAYSLYKDGAARMLYVPALEYAPTDGATNHIVLVPLVKEIFDEMNSSSGRVILPYDAASSSFRTPAASPASSPVSDGGSTGSGASSVTSKLNLVQ